jgi:NADH dehydrogenase
MLESASVEPDPERRKRMLTFVVAGGGFAGVETVGAINDLARQSLQYYGRIDPREVRVLLIHGGPVILPELGEALGLYAQEKLRKRQVEIKLKTRVSSYADGAVHCDDGEAVHADVLVWAGGASPSPILKDTVLELQRGRVTVDSTLEVPGFPGVWAVGDCAAIIDPSSRNPYPPTAQHALREGRQAAKNICARLNAEKPTPFVYKAPGQLASIGRRTGVARICGLNFSGVIGWVLWRTVYLMKLPRLEKKIRVGLQWARELVLERDIAQYINPRDIESFHRLLETARQPHAAPSPKVSAAEPRYVGSERIAS